ncbi:MAG: DinB family protein [Bacteroidota bacterium]
MNLTEQIAKQMRDVHFGGNWTVSNLRDNMADVTWEQAITRIDSFNTIATLVYHTHYFVGALLMVLEGKPLDANDKYSFDHPPILSGEDWTQFLDKVWADAERCATLIETLPESRLMEDFADKKYGTYYGNIHGIIEHTHYHLGQIVVIKKLVQQGRG